MNLPDDIREKLRKLKALAERGIGGEARAAQAQYDRILAEFSLTDEDVEAPDKVRERYTPRDRYELLLLQQIYAYVCRTSRLTWWQAKGSRTLQFEATPAQHQRIKTLLDTHRKPFAAHMERSAAAYCHANDLLSPPSGKPSTMDPKEAAALRRLIGGIDRLADPTRPALGSGPRALGE